MPAPKPFGCDTGLQTRMLVTMFLLGLTYVVLIAVLIAAGTGVILLAVIAGVLFLRAVLHLGQDRALLDGCARGDA